MNKDNNFNYQSYYKNLRTENSSGLEKSVLKLINIKTLKRKNPGAKILELGFGKGDLILDLIKEGFNVRGVDISQENVRTLQEKLKGKNVPSSNISYGDILKTSFPDEEFDIIIACEVLEHITSLDEAVKEMNRILKPQGTIIISVPYRQKIKMEECIFCHRMTPRDGHIHSFSKKSTLRLFKKYNIEVQKMEIRCSKRNLFPCFIDKLYIFPFSLVFDYIDLVISRIFNLFPPFLLLKFKKNNKNH